MKVTKHSENQAKFLEDQNDESQLGTSWPETCFSIGRAMAPTPEELDDAIHRADYRMYREK